MFDIPAFTATSYDKQLLKDNASNDGAAFQQFIGELLSVENLDVIAYGSAGRDGGIDHSFSADGVKTVVECKFIGEDSLVIAKQRFAETAKNLQTHLASPDGPKSAQYSPWYQTDQPIGRYDFYLSCQTLTDNQQLELTELIQATFDALAQRPHLKHLTGLTVAVWSWNRLAARLKNQPPLLYRWFAEYRVTGLLAFESDKRQQRGFRAFLSNDTLPYLMPDQPQQQPQTLLDQLARPNINGTVISGMGGVGKTRLIFEIGRLAIKQSDWLVLQVDDRWCSRQANEEPIIAAFTQLLKQLVNAQQKVLLLLDYAESQRYLLAILNTIEDYNDQGRQFRYVVNCRTSHYHHLRTLAGHYHIALQNNLNDHDQFTGIDSEGFNHQLVKHILATSQVPDAADYYGLCLDLPVLAVFISWLHSQNKQTDLTALKDEQDFYQWLVKRLVTTGQSLAHGGAVGTVTGEEDLVQLLLLYPLSLAASEHLAAQQPALATIHQRLYQDGWVYEGGVDEGGVYEDKNKDTQFLLVHDVFADQLVLNQLNLLPVRTKEQVITRSLRLAGQCDQIDSCLIAWQRIMADLGKLDWPRLLNQQIAPPEAVGQPSAPWLNKQSHIAGLLSLADLVRCWRLNPSYWQCYDHYDYYLLLADKIKQCPLADMGVDGLVDAFVDGLVEGLVDLLSHQQMASQRLLAAAMQFKPATFQPLLLAKLRDDPSVTSAGQLYSIWLRSGAAATEIKPYLQQWLALPANCCHYEASFLYPNWLKSTQDYDFVRGPVGQWLQANPSLFAAQFVYSGWLNAGGDTIGVAAGLKQWLAAFQQTPAAGFVYTAWLDAGGETALVAAGIAQWLSKHQHTAEAGFVFAAWLDAGGETTWVADAIVQWLSEHQHTAEAQFVYKAWLDAGGATTWVADGIVQWLSEHQQTAAARFVYKAWLDAGGATTWVADAIAQWLSEHQHTAEAQFVYTAWLDAGGATTGVADAIAQWLSEHQHTAEARFIYKAWLNAGGATTWVADGIAQWLSEHQHTPEAQFVYKAWLDAGGATTGVADGIVQWLSEHQHTAEAQFVYKAWLDAGGPTTLVADGIVQWLSKYQHTAEAGFVYAAWLDAGGATTGVADAIVQWLSKFQHTAEAQFVYTAWLDAGGATTWVADTIVPWLSEHQHTAAADFVYVAWLKAGGETTWVADGIVQWLSEHQQTAEAGFVYKAWLDAGGDKNLVAAPLGLWLAKFQQQPQSDFVYKAWLKAAGDKSLVAGPLAKWLELHQQAPDADHLYRAWLDAGGATTLVAKPIALWLAKFQHIAEAQFVYTAWLKAGGDKALVAGPIQAWLTLHHRQANASYVYIAWLKNTKDLTAVKGPLQGWLAIDHHRRSPNGQWLVSIIAQQWGYQPLLVGAIEDQFAALLAMTDPNSPEVVLTFNLLYQCLHNPSDAKSLDYWQKLLKMYGKWFIGFVDFSVWQSHPKARSIENGTVIQLTMAALTDGAIHRQVNRLQIQAFVDWLERWGADRKKRAAGMVSAFKRQWLPPADR